MEALLAVYDSDGLGLLCLNKHAAVPNRTDGRALNSQGLVNTALIGLPSWRMIIKMIQDLHPAPIVNIAGNGSEANRNFGMSLTGYRLHPRRRQKNSLVCRAR